MSLERLWNTDAEERYGDKNSYQEALLEQYKLYVEMADRISQRRGLANTFFLTLNTLFLTAFGSAWREGSVRSGWWLLFPLLAVLIECSAWFYIVRSYRLLNTAKFNVVGALEERLPASPYRRGEWWALGEGNDWRRYWPLSHIEKWIPILFGTVYVAGFVALLVA